MTEQEFRELTAYQPPSPPPKAHSPAVASVAAAVAAVKTPEDNSPQEPSAPFQPPAPEPIQVQPPAHVPVPDAAEIPAKAQIQTTAQAHAQPQVHSAPPVQAAQPIEGNIPRQSPPSQLPAAPHVTSEMVSQQKHDELREQFARLSDRFKHLAEERDALSRQVTELRRVIAEKGESGNSTGHDYKEEIRLLGKLIDDEQSLRNIAIERGAYKPGEDPYARHDKLVSVFLNIVGKTE